MIEKLPTPPSAALSKLNTRLEMFAVSLPSPMKIAELSLVKALLPFAVKEPINMYAASYGEMRAVNAPKLPGWICAPPACTGVANERVSRLGKSVTAFV